jgi:23S rRNA G2445 N2-methylase RlmL
MSKGLFQLFARTVHGIEWIAASEIESHFSATITDIQHREIRFSVNQLERGLLNLGSIDDVFLKCKLIKGLDHTRATLPILGNQSVDMDFSRMISSLRSLRNIPQKPTFDVIASFLGRRNYNRFEIEDIIGSSIAKAMRWKYSPQREKNSPSINISFRIHLTGNEAILGVRLSEMPLHRRAYKQGSRTGTLHPPLAFAMGLIASLKTHDIVLDPFCGVGTIPIEVLRIKPDIEQSIGIDIDAESINKAAENALIAKVLPTFLRADAGRLPFGDGAINKIISNPPWGKAVEAKGHLKEDFKPFFRELERITRHDSRIILLNSIGKSDFQMYSRDKFNVLFSIPVSLFGSWAEISLLTKESAEKLFFNEYLNKYWQLRSSIESKTTAKAGM